MDERRYGCGWLPDYRIHEGTLERFGGGAPPPSEWLALTRHFIASGSPFPLDQSITSSCVAHASKAALFARGHEQGLGDVLIDVHHLYTSARRLNAPLPATLLDHGLYPRDAVDVMDRFGVMADEGFDPAHINDELFVDEVETAATHIVSGWRRIPDAIDDSDAVELTDEMKRALYAGFPFMFGMDLDHAYSDYTDGVYERQPNARSAGRHMQCAIGYTKDGVLVLNSWGLWGAVGRSLVGWKTMASMFVSDRYVLEVAVKP